MIICKLSQIIADFLISEKIIKAHDREIYSYGFELCISSIISIISIILIALITGQFFECAIFYFVFCVTRLFSGGYHSDCYLGCKLTFLGVLLSELFALHLLKNADVIFWNIVLFFSIGTILALAPISNPNKEIIESQKKKYKIILSFLLLFYLVVMLLMINLHCLQYRMIPLTLFYVALLMVAGIIKERRRKLEKNY